METKIQTKTQDSVRTGRTEREREREKERERERYAYTRKTNLAKSFRIVLFITM